MNQLARPSARNLIGPEPKSALWLATILVVFALTINWWAPLFY